MLDARRRMNAFMSYCTMIGSPNGARKMSLCYCNIYISSTLTITQTVLVLACRPLFYWYR